MENKKKALIVIAVLCVLGIVILGIYALRAGWFPTDFIRRFFWLPFFLLLLGVGLKWALMPSGKKRFWDSPEYYDWTDSEAEAMCEAIAVLKGLYPSEKMKACSVIVTGKEGTEPSKVMVYQFADNEHGRDFVVMMNQRQSVKPDVDALKNGWYETLEEVAWKLDGTMVKRIDGDMPDTRELARMVTRLKEDMSMERIVRADGSEEIRYVKTEALKRQEEEKKAEEEAKSL